MGILRDIKLPEGFQLVKDFNNGKFALKREGNTEPLALWNQRPLIEEIYSVLKKELSAEEFDKFISDWNCASAPG